MMRNTPTGQTGSTLIVALVFLVVLTVAGISAMQFSTLEERMASNSQFRNETFQQTQSAIQTNLIALNANASGRARLLEAMSAASNSSTDCENDYPINLCTQKREQLGLTTTAKQAVNSAAAQSTNDGFSVIRNTAAAKPCEASASGASSIVNFECSNFELHIREELPNGAYSDQSQGLIFMNIKAKS